MSNDLKALIGEEGRGRDALLLAEIGAWLHMFGKLHEDFLRGNHDMDTQIPTDVPADLTNLLTHTWTGYGGPLCQDTKTN